MSPDPGQQCGPDAPDRHQILGSTKNNPAVTGGHDRPGGRRAHAGEAIELGFASSIRVDLLVRIKGPAPAFLIEARARCRCRELG